MKPLVGGAIYSGRDYRDGIAALSMAGTITQPLPSTYQTDLSPIGVPYDQSKVPACVSHAWAELMKLYWYRKTGQVINFSPRFLDILSTEPDIPLDGGRRPRTVAKISASMGCATIATVPNDTSLPIAAYRNQAVITDVAKEEALKYRIPGFLSIDLDQLRQGVHLYEAVSVLMLIGAEWWTPSWADQDIDPLRTPNPILGGHQTLTKGWTMADLNTLRNSWGINWARNGESDYSSSGWRPYMKEAWTIAEIPTDVRELLANLPKASDFHYQWNQNLHYGDDNEDVKWLQVCLMILGFLAPIPPDELGIYGLKTAAAVGKYQAAHGIFPVPDSCGPLTRTALNAQFSISN